VVPPPAPLDELALPLALLLDAPPLPPAPLELAEVVDDGLGGFSWLLEPPVPFGGAAFGSGQASPPAAVQIPSSLPLSLHTRVPGEPPGQRQKTYTPGSQTSTSRSSGKSTKHALARTPVTAIARRLTNRWIDGFLDPWMLT